MGRENPATFNISMESLDSELELSLEDNSMEINTTLREGYGPTTIVDYDNDVIHKPQIEGVTLEGNKTFEELGLIIDSELSAESANPVENQAITQVINTIIEKLNITVIDCGTSASVM